MDKKQTNAEYMRKLLEAIDPRVQETEQYNFKTAKYEEMPSSIGPDGEEYEFPYGGDVGFREGEEGVPHEGHTTFGVFMTNGEEVYFMADVMDFETNYDGYDLSAAWDEWMGMPEEIKRVYPPQ